MRKEKDVQGEVLWKAGPWRSSGDWWEREAWSRDEWDIALQNNALRNGEVFLSTAWCTICSAAAGLWKERMTELGNGFSADQRTQSSVNTWF